MSLGPRGLLMQLSERTSAKGNYYLSGWLGKASVVAFRGEDDKHGNPTWDLFVSTPEPRAEVGQEPAANRSARAETVAQRSPARYQDGWRSPSAYRRPGNGAARAPAADGGAFHEDSLEDVGR